ncbi:MAG: HD family phosphohydrolase [Christensenellaceae bacterium]|jgi:putative nucleotidyltransferase with HDIG domain
MAKYKLNENKRNTFVNILMTAGALAICLVIAMVSSTAQTYDITEGGISPETITAPVDVVDDISTQRLIAEEQQKVDPVYKKDTAISQQVLAKTEEDFASIIAAQQHAEEIYRADQEQKLQEAEAALRQSEAEASAAESAAAEASGAPLADASADPTPIPTPAPTAYVIQPFNAETADWQALLTEENVKELKDALPEYLADEDILAVLSMSQTQMTDLKDAVNNSVQSALLEGIDTDTLSHTKTEIITDIVDQFGFSSEKKAFLEKIISNNVVSNLVFDEEATQAQQDEIAAMVVPVTYKAGQNIVVKGEIVKTEDYEVLRKLGLLSSESTSINPYLAISLYIILMFAMYVIFLMIFNRRLLQDIKKVAILCILTTAAYALTAISQLVAIHIYPIILFVILGSVLLSPKNAMVYSVFLSLLLMSVTTGTQALVANESLGTQSIISSESLIILLTTLIGSFFAVYALKDMRYRSRLIVAGIVSVIPGIVIETIAWLLQIRNTQQLWQIYGIMALSGVLCGIASIGVIPIIENAFRLITPTKLLELSGPDHPLLKRLMFEAPGTYHHSMLVANLAEAGCDAVGGFSLMARVGAYFHDVGKLENPLYFKENQKNNVNPHDALEPKESARIIKKHVPDGIALLKKHNVPKEVQTIVAQHHGNSVARYFYHQAHEADPNVDIKEFQYPGTPPVTKEGAIIMLADVVEAAVRSMDNPTSEEIKEQVYRLIKSLYDEGQLDNAPLNRRDLNQIAEAFVSIFDGVYSHRIKYPDIKIHGAEDGDNVL